MKLRPADDFDTLWSRHTTPEWAWPLRDALRTSFEAPDAAEYAAFCEVFEPIEGAR